MTSPAPDAGPPPFVGLTGAIGAGKSTALAALARLGAATLSTDAVVHELYTADPEVRAAVVGRWGEAVAPDGVVDRAAVARAAFAEDDGRAWLEGLIWPRVGQRMATWREEALAAAPPPAALVVEVPLLFESGMDAAFDATIAVLADDAVRAERAGARGHEELAAREARQLPQDEKARRATFVVRNDRGVPELEAGLADVLAKIRGVVSATRSRPVQGGRPAARRTPAKARRGRTRSRARIWRRRLAVVLVAALAALGGYAALAPYFDRAVQEIALPLRHEDIIRQQARDKGLDPALIAAVIYAESRFMDQTSPTGARGLMQIQPSTANFIARDSGGHRFTQEDLASPQINIAYGSYYLRYLMRRYDGDELRVVAAYNGGETNVNRWVAAAEAEGRDFEADDIPFPETRTYVERVFDAREDYRREYARELGL